MDVLFDDVFGVEVRNAVTAVSPAGRAVDEVLDIRPRRGLGHGTAARYFGVRTAGVERPSAPERERS
jgi:hypothetical protein